MTDRQRMLLEDAAECFLNITSPFYPEWLSERNVTADECFWLSETIGNYIKDRLIGNELLKELYVGLKARNETWFKNGVSS